MQNPIIIPRDKHNISRKNISSNALKVLQRLHHAGFQSFLVGGSVRDLLLGNKPKDFDVATDAKPEQIKHLFRNCRLIGKRFRLAHIHFGAEIIEVATFRADHSKGADKHGQMRDGMIIRDNVYGSLKDDAWRRDFRINALYYNIADFSVVDYTGGIEDIRKRQICMIGNPQTRYQEDPVRMLRAIRFASKLNLSIHKSTAQPLTKISHLLSQIPPSRLFEEVLKLLLHGCAVKNFTEMCKYQLFKQLFPLTIKSLEGEHKAIFEQFILLALTDTDTRVVENKKATPAFILAVLLWEPIQTIAAKLRQQRLSPMIAMEKAIQQVLTEQNQSIMIPRRFTHSMREIWLLQPQFIRRQGNRAEKLFNQPRFRAAYDFLLLRAKAGEKIDNVASWWQNYIHATEEQRQKLVADLPKRPRAKKQL